MTALSEYLSMSLFISQALLRAMLDYCLCYCKTPSCGLPDVRGEAGCLIWSGCVRLIPMS